MGQFPENKKVNILLRLDFINRCVSIISRSISLVKKNIVNKPRFQILESEYNNPQGACVVAKSGYSNFRFHIFITTKKSKFE